MGEPTEITRFAHWPVQRGRLQVDLGDNLIDQFQWFTANPIPFVNHSDDRQSSRLAHPKQLQSLRLKTFGGIDKHDRGVNGGEHTVGVF